jgi:hypothetical protein
MSTDEMNRKTMAVSDLQTSALMEQRAKNSLLLSKYAGFGYKENPAMMSVKVASRDTRNTINQTKMVVSGVNNTARKAAAEGKKQAETILEKFAQTHYGDRLIQDSAGLNPMNTFERANQLEAAKPLSIQNLESTVRSQEALEQVRSRVGTQVPAKGNKPIYDLEEGYLANFGSDKAVAQLLKSCIPCEFRKLNFTAEFGMPWANTLDDLKKKWKDLLKMLKDLITYRPGEFSTDLCNLFKFLDGQCIPDITGLLSLLSLMQLKYSDLGSFSLLNIISQLVAPFLTPVIGEFTSNLDQFSDLILGPLKCVVRALEFQIIQLQEQANGVAGIGIDSKFRIRGNIADQNRIKYRQNQINFIEAKAKALRNRKRQLAIGSKERLNRELSRTDDGNTLNSNIRSTAPILGYSKGKMPDPTREEKIIKTNLVRGGIRLFGESKTSFETDGDTGLLKPKQEESWQRTIEDEDANINTELEKLEKDRRSMQDEIREVSADASTVDFSGATNLTTATRFALDNMQRSFTSVIKDLTYAVNDGIGIVKQSIDMYREEFQRLLLGRISTQQDQLEYTRMLQNVARLFSIVAAVDQFKKAGMNLRKFCEQGEDKALDQITKGLKANDAIGMFDFYKATDTNGNPLIVITPGGAKVSVSSVDFDPVGGDALFGDSSVNLDSVTKTVSFNDLNEVDKMNREGIVPDLGNIDGKNIELSMGIAAGTELDLHFKTSYAIISNEFCSKSAIAFGSSDTVKKWAENLWQKR